MNAPRQALKKVRPAKSWALPELVSVASGVGMRFVKGHARTPRSRLVVSDRNLVRPLRIFCPCRVGSVTGADANCFQTKLDNRIAIEEIRILILKS
jgi:hypothetical protein